MGLAQAKVNITFPTHVGINRELQADVRGVTDVPHARGD